MNYIKDIAIGDVEKGIVNAVIEIPIGTNVKYEVSSDGSKLVAVRELFSKFKYPFNYGFIPQTFAGDKDPMDIIVINDEPIVPMTVVSCKIVGVIRTVDNGEQDDKILAVPVYAEMAMSELRRKVKEVFKFLNIYKYPHNKDTKVEIPELDVEVAKEIIKSAMTTKNGGSSNTITTA